MKNTSEKAKLWPKGQKATDCSCISPAEGRRTFDFLNGLDPHARNIVKPHLLSCEHCRGIFMERVIYNKMRKEVRSELEAFASENNIGDHLHSGGSHQEVNAPGMVQYGYTE
jgi:hypothetical protein